MRLLSIAEVNFETCPYPIISEFIIRRICCILFYQLICKLGWHNQTSRKNIYALSDSVYTVMYLNFTETPTGTPTVTDAPRWLNCVIFFSHPYSSIAPNVPTLNTMETKSVDTNNKPLNTFTFYIWIQSAPRKGNPEQSKKSLKIWKISLQDKSLTPENKSQTITSEIRKNVFDTNTWKFHTKNL